MGSHKCLPWGLHALGGSPSEKRQAQRGSHRNGELERHDDEFPDCGGASGPEKLFKTSEQFSANEASARKRDGL